MKQRQTIILNGKPFTLCKEVTNRQCSHRSLFDCYGKPSSTKVSIWESWLQWFHDQYSSDFGVASYNCNFFTIEGKVEKDGQLYYIYITSTRQEAYPIVD